MGAHLMSQTDSREDPNWGHQYHQTDEPIQESSITFQLTALHLELRNSIRRIPRIPIRDVTLNLRRRLHHRKTRFFPRSTKKNVDERKVCEMEINSLMN